MTTINQTPLINMQRRKRKKSNISLKKTSKPEMKDKKRSEKSSEIATKQVIKWQEICISQ